MSSKSLSPYYRAFWCVPVGRFSCSMTFPRRSSFSSSVGASFAGLMFALFFVPDVTSMFDLSSLTTLVSQFFFVFQKPSSLTLAYSGPILITLYGPGR